jgi:hypothetical protein
MTPSRPLTCPRCNARGVRCSGCGAFYEYWNHAAMCLGTTCRSTGAPLVCRCGRVHEPPA